MPRRDWEDPEIQVRNRPSKKGSRPRTKQRPEHADAVIGLVTGVDRGRYTLLLEPDTPAERNAVAMKARELGRERVVCGDLVEVVGDTSGAKDTLGRIVRITPRKSVLRRTADDTDPYERIIVANADQMVIVTALADPPPRTGMIDRCVVAAYTAGVDVLLCLTKADLADPQPLRDLYEPLGVKVVVTKMTSDKQIAPLEQVQEALEGKVSVLVGHSGVGKSTLVNSLIPNANRATGLVNDVTGRGRHTSTSAVALELSSSFNNPDAARAGWVIDTPGVRSFGLAHVEPEMILASFPELNEVAEEYCPRGCTHAASAPDCALDSWETDTTDPDEQATRAHRVSSLRRLLQARGSNTWEQ